jgi:leader peptidase (prepilin peptidase)/N-methyltransferase
VLTWFLIALAFIDMDTQYLPDSLTLPLLWLGLLVSLAGAAQANASIPVDLRSSVIGAVAGYLSLWSVYQLFRLATGKEGMGYGDFKLLSALGAWLGWQLILPIVLVAAAVGALVGAILLSVQGRDRATPVAFGPYLAASGWLMLLCGHEIVERYFGFFAVRP